MTRSQYRSALVFMGAKTDPFLTPEDLLAITRDNLKVFSKADIFLLCQTRSPKAVEDPEILGLLQGHGVLRETWGQL